jgi:adenine deaminase
MNISISGHIVDIPGRRIYDGEVQIRDGVISDIVEKDNVHDQFLLPGFIDSHIHIESSMLVPSEFARLAVVHGTVATVSDPHEIGNVLGVPGVDYMIDNGKQVPFKFFFGAPSCVPATAFESTGAVIDAEGVKSLLERREIKYLAEMMNWPGVLQGDAMVLSKIDEARKKGKRVDGHAPGLKGEQAARYVAAGISTDHECFTAQEALDKLKCGMKILIREGSAARNFDALIGLMDRHWQNMMFCSDDKHPDSLVLGHIDILIKRALEKGIDLFKVLTAACLNPITHYKLEVGQLRKDDPADFIAVDNLRDFKVRKTFVNGILVAENGITKIARSENQVINNFKTSPKKPADFVFHSDKSKIRVIEALDQQLITTETILPARRRNGCVESDVASDVLKIAVINRYQDSKPAIAFIKNVGLRQGAIASSVGHDSHNIIAVGVDDESICEAVNMIIGTKGGVSAVNGETKMILPLPVGGIMSAEDGYEVASKYQAIDAMAKAMGSQLGAPFMTLSFMALLVIPSLKLSDRGLFNSDGFKFVEVGVD